VFLIFLNGRVTSCRSKLLVLILYWFLAFPSGLTLAAETEGDRDKYSEKLVTKVSFITANNLSFDDLSRGMPKLLNRKLKFSELEIAREQLVSREIFRDVKYILSDYGEGVQVKFVLSPRPVISKVYFSGESGLDRERLSGIEALILGQVLNDSSLAKLENLVESFLETEGFLESNIVIREETSKNEPYAHLEVEIVKSDRAVIQSIDFVTPLVEDLEQVMANVIVQYLGDSASERNISALEREILIASRKEGYLQATIEKINSEKAGADIRLELSLKEGNPITLIFRGNNAFSPSWDRNQKSSFCSKSSPRTAGKNQAIVSGSRLLCCQGCC